MKKVGKKRDVDLAELQAQNLNLSTELRAMRRELSAAGADPAAAAAVQAPTATATVSVDKVQFATMQKELTQLRNRNRQLETM